MITKQQEFLENLKNPTKVRLKRAVNEFYENHGNSLHSAIVYEHCEGEFIVEIMADNHIILFSANQILISTIRKHLKNPSINVRLHPDGVKGFFRRTYYVTER